MFKWIVGLSALLIAGTAAYFSVTGIALLFSGATLGVAIMAGSLELGKLVAASYLHRYWNKINFLFKFYFTTAVLSLIFITSMGIFGFLSNAYQKTSLQVQQVESQVDILLAQRSGLTDDISRSERRIQTLTDQRSSQEARYDSLVVGENWVNARRTFELIEGADTEIRELTSQINETRQKISDIDTQVLTIRSENMDIAREIGGFRFIADAFNVPIDTAVKWFIIMLIFVFDPLAVSLVIAYNKLTEVTDDTTHTKKYKIYGEEKENQRRTLVEMMNSDEEEELYDEPNEKLKNAILSFNWNEDDDKSDEELWENSLEDGLDDIPYEESQVTPDISDTNSSEKDLGRVSDTPQIKPNSKKVIEN